MTTHRFERWRLPIAVAIVVVITDPSQALGVTRRRDYLVSHDFRLTPGGNIVPTVTARYYAHAYVRERRPDCSEDTVIPAAQPAGWNPLGRDFLRSRGRDRTRGRTGATVDAVTAVVPIPAGGFGPMTFTAEAGAIGPTPVCTSSAQANSLITVDPFGAGTPVTGTIRSFGFAQAVRPPARYAKAYAFSMTMIEAQGGRLLRNGRIRWRRVVRDVVSGRAVRRTQRDPIGFLVEDLVTGELTEGFLLTVDIESGGTGDTDVGFIWEDDEVTILGNTEVTFDIEHGTPFNLTPGMLHLEVVGGEVTESMDSGVYSGVLPPVNTPLPITFPLANEIEFDYDLGEFDGHDLNVTIDLSGNGEAESELGSEDVPTVSEWGLIIMTVLAFTAGTVLYGRRRSARRAA